MRVVHVAGRLVRESSAELTSLCEEVSGALRIDLSDLLSADDAGLEALALLESRGAALVGLSPYLALRLQIARAARAGQPRDDPRAGRA